MIIIVMIAYDGAINVLCAETIIRMMTGVHLIEKKDIEKELVAFIAGCTMTMVDYV